MNNHFRPSFSFQLGQRSRLDTSTHTLSIQGLLALRPGYKNNNLPAFKGMISTNGNFILSKISSTALPRATTFRWPRLSQPSRVTVFPSSRLLSFFLSSLPVARGNKLTFWVRDTFFSPLNVHSGLNFSNWCPQCFTASAFSDTGISDPSARVCHATMSTDSLSLFRCACLCKPSFSVISQALEWTLKMAGKVFGSSFEWHNHKWVLTTISQWS